MERLLQPRGVHLEPPLVVATLGLLMMAGYHGTMARAPGKPVDPDVPPRCRPDTGVD
jgi:hypothetical protein